MEKFIILTIFLLFSLYFKNLFKTHRVKLKICGPEFVNYNFISKNAENYVQVEWLQEVFFIRKYQMF